MCEKLFKHVGEFREHAAEHVKKIVDNMHHPNKTGIEESLLPLPEKQISDEYKVLMDEIDQCIYQAQPGGESNIYASDNIIYKLTTPSETLITQVKFDDGSTTMHGGSQLQERMSNMPS